MTATGRPPKSIDEHLLNGSYRPNRHGKRAASLEPSRLTRAPTCPAWLSPEGKAEWARVASELARTGRLTALDVAAFTCYCQSYGRWREADAALAEQGLTIADARGNEVANPLVGIASQHARAALTFGRDFGLTPDSRRRLPATLATAWPADPLADLLDS